MNGNTHDPCDVMARKVMALGFVSASARTCAAHTHVAHDERALTTQAAKQALSHVSGVEIQLRLSG